MLNSNNLIGFGAAEAAGGPTYRYLRVNITASPYTTDSIAREIEFSTDGATWFNTGTATANNEASGDADLAKDGNTATFWQTSSAVPNWWQLDLGAGNEKEVHYWRIRTFNNSLDRTPTAATLKASNTGAFGGEEVTLHTLTGGSGGSDNVWLTFGPF